MRAPSRSIRPSHLASEPPPRWVSTRRLARASRASATNGSSTPTSERCTSRMCWLAATRTRPPPSAHDLDAANGHLVKEVEQLLGHGYTYYHDVLRQFADRPDRAVIAAMARLSAEGRLERDGEGRYRLSTPSNGS